MSYIARADIDNIFGTANVTAWSQLDATIQDTADSARIATAIAWAEEDVENRLRDGRYAIPLAGTSGTLPKCVVEWCAVKAGVWLYRSRGMTTTANDGDADRYAGMEKYANEQIDLVIAGKVKPALQRQSSPGPSGPTAIADTSGGGSAAQNVTSGGGNWWE